MPTKICPFCAEEIKTEAIKCKHCGSILSDNAQPHAPMQSVATDKAKITLPIRWDRVLFGGFAFLGCLAGAAYSGYAFFQAAQRGPRPEGYQLFWIVALLIVGTIFVAIALARSFKCSFCGSSRETTVFVGHQVCGRCDTRHIIDWAHRTSARDLGSALLGAIVGALIAWVGVLQMDRMLGVK
jgi:hypothetical protein